MYCRKCGQQITDNSAFCAFCGTKTTESPSTRDPAETGASFFAVADLSGLKGSLVGRGGSKATNGGYVTTEGTGGFGAPTESGLKGSLVGRGGSKATNGGYVTTERTGGFTVTPERGGGKAYGNTYGEKKAFSTEKTAIQKVIDRIVEWITCHVKLVIGCGIGVAAFLIALILIPSLLSNPFSDIAKGVNKTLSAESFSFSAGLNGEYMTGMVVYDLDKHILEIFTNEAGRNRSEYLLYKNGVLCSYHIKDGDWECTNEDYSPEIEASFEYLNGDLEQAERLLNVDSKLTLDTEQFEEAEKAIFTRLSSKDNLKNILGYEKDGDNYSFSPDIYELLMVVVEEMQPYIFYKNNYYQVLDELEEEKGYFRSLDVFCTITLDDGYFTGISGRFDEGRYSYPFDITLTNIGSTTFERPTIPAK